ncbi:hypothetical protein LAZ67_19002309 [Cordylochernes scorpioides]|uniref:N-acetyltransferase domain-containing protein n=1 Tax=Cordylochernes scorpioides TaxID=51811 RepID=A0ABY6LN91_9ARAC|nr:hypothetical protein LAZ67_19002309 [Cordylochernes scorpioides]
MGQQRLVESDINIRAAEFSELQTVGMFISTLRNGNYEIKEKIYVIRRLSEPLWRRGFGSHLCHHVLMSIHTEFKTTTDSPVQPRSRSAESHVRKHLPMFPHVTQRSVTSAARVSQLLFCSLYEWTLKHGGSDNWIKYEPVYRKISIFAYLGR